MGTSLSLSLFRNILHVQLGNGRQHGRLDFPLCIFQRRGTKGKAVGWLFFQVCEKRTCGYILISLEVESGSPRTICPFPQRMLPFASGSLGWRSKSKRRIDLRRSEQNARERKRNSVMIFSLLVPLRVSLRSLSPLSRCFSHFCADRPGGFVPATYFPPAFYSVPDKNEVRSRDAILGILTRLHRLNK